MSSEVTRTEIFPLHGVAQASQPLAFAWGRRAWRSFPRRAFASLADGGFGWIFTHEDDSFFLSPANESEAAFQGFPAIASVLPERSLAHHAVDEIFDLGGMAEIEEVGQAALLVLGYDRLAAVAAIATGKGGGVFPWSARVRAVLWRRHARCRG